MVTINCDLMKKILRCFHCLRKFVERLFDVSPSFFIIPNVFQHALIIEVNSDIRELLLGR